MKGDEKGREGLRMWQITSHEVPMKETSSIACAGCCDALYRQLQLQTTDEHSCSTLQYTLVQHPHQLHC